ncbi:MAG TPA: alanine racemase [Candidatus Nanopelagicaceae bacterium]|nr:alanine racemase [Candidatus Nanopelagicaceae bacterium]
MGLSLHINAEIWRAHITAFSTQHPGLVPVIKGEGYGLGATRLVHEVNRLGIKRLAVGTPTEADEIGALYAGEILILTPWRPGQHRTPGAIHTLSSLTAIESWHDQAPVVVEILTDTRRHGIPRSEYGGLAKLIGGVSCQGLVFHLPLSPTRSPQEMVATEIRNLIEDGISPTSFNRTIWVSHMPATDLTNLREKYPSIIFLERVGTKLWLGAAKAMRSTATVLDKQRVTSGDRVGYRQRRVRKNGWLLIVAGGTQHGIGLEAPPSDLSFLGRLKILSKAILVVAGIQRSPYSYAGKRLLFAEPPHMQCSLLFWVGEGAPEIGNEIDVTLRHTTTRFDEITE